MKIYFIVFTLSAIAACSNEAIYNSIQSNSRASCQKLPSPQNEECIKQSQKPYSAYKKERKELTKD